MGYRVSRWFQTRPLVATLLLKFSIHLLKGRETGKTCVVGDFPARENFYVAPWDISASCVLASHSGGDGVQFFSRLLHYCSDLLRGKTFEEEQQRFFAGLD